MDNLLDRFLDWSTLYFSNLIWSLVVLVTYLVVTRLALPRIKFFVDKSKFKAEATKKAFHTVKLLVGIVTVAALLVVWGVDFGGLLILSTSILTLTGVAMFASWSLLSNITAYFVLLFHNAFRRGNFVRIMDADNYMEGYIADVNLFNTKIVTDDREVIIYPNNLILTRPCIINPRSRWKVIGKVTDKNEKTTPEPCPEEPVQKEERTA